jgi:hypothetical protein
MSTSIDQAFVTMYEGDVHEAYQRQGSLLRNTVRLKAVNPGEKCVFQITGKGQAGKKTRHGNVPIMNIDHTNVTATMEDWYAAEYIDNLDELKINIDERMVAANGGAWALGRKIDDLVITPLATGTNVVAEGSAGLTKSKILSGFETLNNLDVPDDGQRFAIVGAHQWNELLNISEFKSSDFASNMFPWLKGTESKRWLNMTWILHTGLPLASGTRSCFFYHRSAIGLGENCQIKAFIDWVPEKASHLVDHMMSAGAVKIDDNGIVKIQCDDDAVIAA